MPIATDPRLLMMAKACVQSMGDVFGDADAARRSPMHDYSDPREIATACVEETLQDLAVQLDTSAVYPSTLRDEYSGILAEIPKTTDDAALAKILAENAEWTSNGARVVVRLARQYGTSVLRSALAVADAMGIEDGDSKF